MAIDNIRAGPIRNKDIPFLARSCLEEYDELVERVNVSKIAREMGIKIIRDSDIHVLSPDEWGKFYYYPEKDARFIVYDDSERRSLEEKRFTIAHEIGHCYLNHYAEHVRFMAYIEELKHKHGLRTERQADLFAKHLLKGEGL